VVALTASFADEEAVSSVVAEVLEVLDVSAEGVVVSWRPLSVLAEMSAGKVVAAASVVVVGGFSTVRLEVAASWGRLPPTASAPQARPGIIDKTKKIAVATPISLPINLFLAKYITFPLCHHRNHFVRSAYRLR
jgi:hypothetical protein